MRALDHSPLTEEERLVLEKLEQALATATSAKVLIGHQEQAIELPGAVFQLLQQVVRHTGEGKMFFIQDKEETLTTQEAADILDVSRPYLIKLLETGKIPFVKVGTHRRIRANDLMSFKVQLEHEQDEVIAEMARLSQELGLYD